MRNGLYKVEFRTPLGFGAGVVTLHDGTVGGGDSGMYYAGTYQIKDSQFSASVAVRRHTAGVPSTLGTDNATLNLSGNISGDRAQLAGTTPNMPNLTFQAVLSRLAD